MATPTILHSQFNFGMAKLNLPRQKNTWVVFGTGKAPSA